MKTINRSDLKKKIDMNNPATTLIETLPEESFKEFHLPGAINIPIDDQFDESVQQAVPDKDQEVVVYCKDASCNASPQAARRLEELGYTNVLDYEAGKEDWKQAGMPLAS